MEPDTGSTSARVIVEVPHEPADAPPGDTPPGLADTGLPLLGLLVLAVIATAGGLVLRRTADRLARGDKRWR